jgi:MFS family permease
MLKNYVYNLLVRRHYWRHASFSEIAELYISRILRVVGINVASGFASVYLYQLGYSLIFITLIWAFYFVFKVLVLRYAAVYAARYGPKHGILLSNILYIPAMVALGLVPELGLWAVAAWMLSLALSTSIYVLCYNIDFSKIKSFDHAGKEIGFMNIFEKVSVGVSPILGGLVALLFGPQTVMLVGAFVFLISALPLMSSSEQIPTKKRLNFDGFPWRMVMRSIVSRSGIGIDYVATFYAWSMFIAVAIFPGFGNEIYITLGALSAVTIVSASITSYVYGRLIDRDKGGELLKYSVLLNSVIHASRAFVASPAAVVTTNVANEISTSGMQMSYTRGMYDTADISGDRVVYLMLTEMSANLGASIAWLVLAGCVAMTNSDVWGLKTFFFVAALGTLIIGTAKFQMYRK